MNTNLHRVIMEEEPDSRFRLHQGDDQAMYETEQTRRDAFGWLAVVVLGVLAVVALVHLLLR